MKHSLLGSLVACLLTTTPAHAADAEAALRAYLDAAPDARAAQWDAALRKALDSLGQRTPSSGCPSNVTRGGADARFTPLAGDGRYLVEWKAGKGRGAHQAVFAMREAGGTLRIMDTRPLVERAEQAYLDGDLQEAMRISKLVLSLDEDNEEGHALIARVAARLGDASRADKAIAAARQKHPGGSAWRVAAYDVALTLRRADADKVGAECMDAVRAGQLDDGRCFLLHAMQARGGMNQTVLKQEIEEALGRSPDDPALKAAQGLLHFSMARTGKSVDRTLLAQAQLRLREGLACAEALPDGERAAAYHALAWSTLQLDGGPCAEHAERAILLDPTVSEYRRTLQSCTEATLLLANRLNRKALKESSVDLGVEGQAITMALMRDAATYGGRDLPTYQAYSRCRAQVRQTGERLEIRLVNLNGPKRKSREEDAVAAAFMVHTVYRALYGDDAPALTSVRTRYGDDSEDYVFPMPDSMKKAWNSRLPSDKEIASMAKHVVTRPAD